MTVAVRRALALFAIALIAVLAPAGVVLAAETKVSIVDKTFEPKDIAVHVGDKVVWTTTKSINELHSVTSGAPDADPGKVFDSKLGLRDNGQTFEFTFATAGAFPYFCAVHPAEMRGTVTVVEAGASLPPAPTAGPAGSPAGSPAASGAPHEGGARVPVTTQDRLIAGAVLVITLVVLFGAAGYYRRFNG